MKNYFEWLAEDTQTSWWHDSADMQEIERSLESKASGVTTNPPLIAEALRNIGPELKEEVSGVFSKGLPDGERAVALTGVLVRNIAARLSSIHKTGDGRQGYVCAQVNPSLACDRDAMLATARRYASLAPNISVKLPATAAGLEVAETCIAEGMSITVTVSFTLSQALAIGEMCKRADARASRAGVKPGPCFAVIMIGRIDDYIRNIALDMYPKFKESDIRQAGIAVVKRAYAMYTERGYGASLCIAALRGPYHMSELAGAKLVMSIHPKQQKPLLAPEMPREARIGRAVAEDVIERLSALPEFRKAYEPDGLMQSEFLSYGATQCTVSQFIESGWKRMESFKMEECK